MWFSWCIAKCICFFFPVLVNQPIDIIWEICMRHLVNLYLFVSKHVNKKMTFCFIKWVDDWYLMGSWYANLAFLTCAPCFEIKTLCINWNQIFCILKPTINISISPALILELLRTRVVRLFHRILHDSVKMVHCENLQEGNAAKGNIYIFNLLRRAMF